MRSSARTLWAVALGLAPLWAQDGCKPLAPCYTAAGVVNSASGEAGFLAPYTFATVYGTNLAFAERSRTAADTLPGIGGLNVMVNGIVSMVFYVSPTQVNFLAPASVRAGEATLQFIREGQNGPAVKVTLLDAAPALFCFLDTPQWAIAQRMPDFSLATPDSPALPDQYVILYATGLGGYAMPVDDYVPPQSAMQIERRPAFQVLLDGVPVDDRRVEYVGSVVHYWGLIQINLKLPPDTGSAPEIRLALGASTSRAGVHLMVQPQSAIRP
jgi:uncharacterized protein (TIGR03437 family)